MTSHQDATWAGEFGRQFTDRNPHTIAELDKLYQDRHGRSRTDLNRQFLASLDASASILEVGSNLGVQLQGLRALGFTDLSGIELQTYAAQLSRALTPQARVAQASAFHLPFADKAFDLVFTSALLLHIPPVQIGVVLDEIHRCARTYIWGLEYYAQDYRPITYHGDDNLLWKADFAKLYTQRFPDLDLVMEERLNYPDGNNQDSMFLLKKQS